MATVVMTKYSNKIEKSLRAKAMVFLEKVYENDASPGLHIEPINGSLDKRYRTGRVDQFWRAVMFKLHSGDENHYYFYGIYPHDESIQLAKRITFDLNPINGLPQITDIPIPTHDDKPPARPRRTPDPTIAPLLIRHGYSRSDLLDRLGIPEDLADTMLEAIDEEQLLASVEDRESWLELIALELAYGSGIDDIIEKLGLAPTGDDENTDDAVLDALRKPAAQFTFIDNQDELRRVIESGDLDAWRVFLHPDQQRYVDKSYNGPFRLSGGAGTGKTVVLIHRARTLAVKNPDSRIVFTTFTTNLAEALGDGLSQLDPDVHHASKPGDPGVLAVGIDALASSVVRRAGSPVAGAVEAVLGEARTAPNSRTDSKRWRAAIESTTTDLGPDIANESFLSSEYGLIVLPNRIRSEAEYLTVRRPGRGVALDRRKRMAVWSLIESYRAQSRIDGSLDFPEAAAVAAAWLESEGVHLADHVLVDEGQDLSPAHWQLLRAMVAPGPDDLFIAEDSHQRIYGSKVVLGRYGIGIVGRAQRLTLNYRTTAQNLGYAMSVLEGGEYVDVEGEPEEAKYRSARNGPRPEVVKAASLDGQLTVVSDRIKKWLDDDTAPEAIAVLVPNQHQRDRITNRLAEKNLPARSVDREKITPGRVSVMTMHRAKGTEFSKVILTDVGHQTTAELERLAKLDETERKDAELRTRSLVYVAATRARDELVVIERV